MQQVLLFSFLLTHMAFAQFSDSLNERQVAQLQPELNILSMVGAPRCAGNDMLLLFAKTSSDLTDLKNNSGTDEEIARHVLALEVLAEGLTDFAKAFGMKVSAEINGNIEMVEIPVFKILGETYPYASSFQSGNRIIFEFTELGICSFYDANTNSIDEIKVKSAINSMVWP